MSSVVGMSQIVAPKTNVALKGRSARYDVDFWVADFFSAAHNHTVAQRGQNISGFEIW